MRWRGDKVRTKSLPTLGLKYLVLLFPALFQVCSAELVFHRRDHKDQGSYGSRINSYIVQTYEDATVRQSSNKILYRTYNNHITIIALNALRRHWQVASTYALRFIHSFIHIEHLYSALSRKTTPVRLKRTVFKREKNERDKFVLCGMGDEYV